MGTLLLGEHFLLLLDDFCLVLEGEGEWETDEEGGGGDYPDDVSDDPSCFLYEGGGLAERGGDGLPGGGGDDVDEGGETVIEGLVGEGSIGCDGGEGVGGVGTGWRGGGVGRVVLVDDLDLDHRCEKAKACVGGLWRCCSVASVMRKQRGAE